MFSVTIIGAHHSYEYHTSTFKVYRKKKALYKNYSTARGECFYVGIRLSHTTVTSKSPALELLTIAPMV